MRAQKRGVSERFKLFRSRSLLTQARLGELIGIGRQAVSDIERGKVSPHYSTVQRFTDLETKYRNAELHRDSEFHSPSDSFLS